MENSKEIKAFNEYKTNVRAIADGVNLLGRHAWMVLKVGTPLMAVVSLLWAWTSLCWLKDVNQFVTTDISITGLPISFLLPLLFFTLSTIVALAQFYSLFQGYVQNGFIPQVTVKSVWKQTFDTLKRNTLIVWLWVLFVYVVYVAIQVYLLSITRYTLFITVPLAVVLLLWNMNLMADFHVQEDSLVRAIPRSLKTTFRGMMSFLMVAVLMLIVGSVVAVIIMTPSLVSSVIYSQASFSLAMEDGADLPGYFNTVYFIFSAISGFLMLIVGFLMLSSWTMVYGAVSHRSSKTNQSLSPTD